MSSRTRSEEEFGCRAKKKVYRTRDAARADVFDYIERFYNTIRRHSTIGYLKPG
jgi:putative transposase